jgi:hypothetical protein
MDREHFDRLSRLVAAAGTRRDALRLLVAGVVAGSVGGAGLAEGRKRHSRDRGRSETGAEQVLNCTDRGCISCANKKIGPGANLTRCDLNRRLDLHDTSLAGSNLTRACLGDADLRNVNFRGAQLQGTCFCGSNLRGADFRGSNVTQEQLACAKVGCTTILPNGKPAVVCKGTETCCNGVCVNIRNDVNNCGACGHACGVCQGCAGGTCEDLPDFQFDCNRTPLRVDSPDLVCTAGPNTGICDLGLCNCGPGGVYDADANVCRCDQDNTDLCAEPPTERCCQIEETCLVDQTLFTTRTQCVDCPSGVRR